MGRVLKPLLVGALALGVAVTGIGIAAGFGASFAAGTFGAGLVSALGTGIIVGSGIAALQGGLSYFQKARSNLSQFDPKSVNIDPAAPRKLAFGLTPLAMDVRYVEPSGSNQEYIDYIVALAAHKCHEVDSIYIEEDLAWTPGGGAVGKFAGYLTIEVILEAGAAAHHTVNGGAIWGSTRRLTGCTTMKVRVKRSDNSKSSQSPFGGGIAGRWTVVGRGMPVYDPARDSTVAGGSGSQRATDQTTWAYTVSGVERGNNPALQLLAFLLGWRIGGEVSVGVGLPADVIDLPSFAAAAALCDESVALAGGGTQRRYEAGRTFSDADDPMAVVTELLKAMNGELTDDGGRLALRIAVNDLTPVVTLTDDDFVGGFSWQPQPPIDQQYTVVRGRYVQPGPPSLFGFADFPEVAIPRTSNAPRPLVLELTAVQEQRRAERIAKQAAQRSLYQGTFTVTLGIRGWLLRRNMVVAITSNARGWTAKLFRVRSLNFNDDGTVEVVFREENAAIYAWDASESAVVTPVAPVVFDSRAAASWLMADIAPGADVTVDQDVVSRLDPVTGRAISTFGSAGTGLAFAQLVASGEARDGDVVTFPTTLPGVPRVLFGPGGKGVAADNIRVEASGLSTSGFTMIAKSQTVTAGSTVTDTGSTTGGTGEPDRVINRTNGSAPFDGRFTFRFSVTVGEISPGEPGTAIIGIFVRKSGNWTQVGEESYSTTGTYNRSVTPGAVDFGTGAEFGVSLLYGEGTGTALSGFTHVQYTPGTVTEASLTPTNAGPISWQAFL